MNFEFEELELCPVCKAKKIRFDFTKYERQFDREFQIFACQCCGLYFVNPRIKKEHLCDLYDASYFRGQNWDDKTDYYSNYTDRNRLMQLEKLYCDHYSKIQCFSGKESPHILDVGCGLGFFSYFASKRFRNVRITPLDFSIEAVEHMQQKGIKAICGDLLHADLEEGAYDAVYMREVLEHLYEPVQYAKKVMSLLRKGGLFFYTTGNTQSVKNIREWNYVRPAGHINYFNPSSIRVLFKKAGLKCYPRELLYRSPRNFLRHVVKRVFLRMEQLPVGYKP